MRKQEQYRPSFSQAELESLVSYLPEGSPLHSKLSVYLLKVNVGLNCAAYIKTGAQERKSLEVQLGLKSSELSETDHIENQKKIKEKLELKAKFAPQLMSDSDRLEYLAQKSLEGTATPEEIEEGKILELKVHGSNFGLFDPT